MVTVKGAGEPKGDGIIEQAAFVEAGKLLKIFYAIIHSISV
jgi:hypothetical protein